MAKIVEEVLYIKVSSIVKDGAGDNPSVFSEDAIGALEDAISEMVGSDGGKIVEITREL